MRAILLVATLILASCAPPQTPSGPASGSTTASETSSKDDPQACVARGGTMRRICLMGELACVETFKDAGKTCTDKKECIGQCRYSGNAAPGSDVVGYCQRTTDPCGCFATVANGKHQGTLCVD